ncbi:amino acid permease [Streptomyces capparidis]
MSHSASPRRLARDEDALLRELDIRPQLTRRMSGFGNAAASFSVISILSGCMTMFAFGMGAGGPVMMLGGWLVVFAAVMCLGASLAEVTSAYPTAGGLFFMADRLRGPRWGWYTGWLNTLGLIGGIAAIDYGAATFVSALLNLQWGIAPTEGRVLAVFACILLLHAVLNLFDVRLVSLLNTVSVWWHLAGVAVIAGALVVVPSHHRSPDFAFEFVNGTGWSSTVYVVALGLLMAQYTFSGYDASAHMSEETTGASVNAPRGIVRAIAWSGVAGFVLIAAMVFAIQDYAGTQASATGVAPAQIFLDALGMTAAKALLLVVIVAQLFCGNAEVAAASRMVFAFSRKSAMPFSARLVRTNRHTAPHWAVLLSVATAFVFALPSLWSATAYGAVVAINVVGMTPAYAIPVLLRLLAGSRFVPGPWNLGRFSKPVGVVAVAWVACVTVVFCLPQSSPVTTQTFNYAPVALLTALTLAWVWWRVRGRHAYTEPTTVDYAGDRGMAKVGEGVV